MEKKSITKIMSISVVILLSIILFILFNFNEDKEPKKLKVGVVNLNAVDKTTMQGFKDKLSELGRVENRDIIYYYDEPAKNVENLKKIVKKMKNRDLDLIFVSSTSATLAIKEAFNDCVTPILFSPVNDPVGSGIVKSLNEPSCQITGVKLARGDDLRLKWLKDISPKIKEVYVPYTIGDGSALATLKQIRKVAPKLGLILIEDAIDESKITENLINNIPNSIDAIFIPRDSRMADRIKSFVELSIEQKIALSAPSYIQVKKKALFSYGHIHYELGKQAGRMANQILNGWYPFHI